MKDCASAIARTAAFWLTALALVLVLPGRAWSEDPRDRGIGGTGMIPADADDDRGIGGTGMMGTIRGFGSIIVNGQHVNYAPNVPVQVDGEPGSASDLKIGQVVRVVARSRNNVLATRQIDVTSEVVGTIEATDGKMLRVLAQTISTDKLGRSDQWRPGERVAVFGLRRPDGTIVASLIERRSAGSEKVAGRLVKRRDGSLRIGQLRLTGVNPALAGTRVVLEGKFNRGVLAVTKAVTERELLGPEVRRFSIEGYVERTRNGLRLGSGLELAGRVPVALPAGSYAPAVVTAVSDKKGRIGLESVTLEGPPVRSSGSSLDHDTRGSAATPSSLQRRKASPPDRHVGPVRSPLDSSRSGTARGNSGSQGSPGNSGNARGGSGAGGGGHGNGGNSGGRGGGNSGGGNSGGGNANGNGSGNGGGGGHGNNGGGNSGGGGRP